MLYFYSLMWTLLAVVIAVTADYILMRLIERKIGYSDLSGLWKERK